MTVFLEELNKIEENLLEKATCNLDENYKKRGRRFLLEHKNKNKYPYFLFEKSEKILDHSIGNKVLLTESELNFCKKLGPLRTACARSSNKKNMIQSGSGESAQELFIEINGLCGEMAFAKMFNLYPEEQFRLEARSTKEDCGDVIWMGKKIDVKTTEYSSGRLTLAQWKVKNDLDYLNKINLLVLFTGDFRKNPEFVYRGGITSEKLLDLGLKQLPGRKSLQYIANQDDLENINTLL